VNIELVILAIILLLADIIVLCVICRVLPFVLYKPYHSENTKKSKSSVK